MAKTNDELKNEQRVFVIDTIKDEKYFVVYYNDVELFKIAKSTNSLEKVENMIGKDEIKEVIR